MSWNRQPAPVLPKPAPPGFGRWVLAAMVAGFVSLLLVLLHASGQIPQVQGVNVWVFAGGPLLAWVLTFGIRAYSYGGTLGQHRFLKEEAEVAQAAWQSWANRYLAVHAHCLLLPDEVSATALLQEPATFPSCARQSRRIAALSGAEDRTVAAMDFVLRSLEPVLRGLPSAQGLHVTLLSDIGAEHHESLRIAWNTSWASDPDRPTLKDVTLAASLSYGWVDEKLKSGGAAFELIVVLQVHGDDAYSDGVAALLLSPDSLAGASTAPVMAALHRPMPLDIDNLPEELPQFMHIQTAALSATGLITDRIEGQAPPGDVIAAVNGLGSALEAQQQWTVESVCGQAGPLSHWLVTALAVEMVRHRQQPLMVLAKDESHWISTVTTGAWA